jgi:hypothetical protein
MNLLRAGREARLSFYCAFVSFLIQKSACLIEKLTIKL